MISATFQRTFNEIAGAVRQGRTAGLYPFGMPFETGQSGTSRLAGRDVIVLTSNNYLGLAEDPRIKEAIVAGLDRYGASTCGARLHNGTTAEHVALEEELAQWQGVEATMVFSSGFMANVGTVGALGDRDTLIATDQLNHMSIVDGHTLAQGPVRIYQHKDLERLEHILNRGAQSPKRLIVTDGVFSMDGDLAPLDELMALAARYEAMVMVDDAHAIGVLGATGRGTGEHFGVRPDVVMGALSKALAGTGGFVGGPQNLIDHLRHTAHSYVFNVAPSPATVAGVRRALELLREERWRQDRLWRNTIRFRSAMLRAGMDVLDSVTPVVPIMIGDDLTAMQIAKELLERGVYIALAVFPAVPHGRSRLRATLAASLSEDEIDVAVHHLIEVASKYRIGQAAA